MSNVRHDYAKLEREYIRGDMGLRELARQHGIINHSVITVQAKKREWVRKREEYRAEASEKAVLYMADEEGQRRAQEAKVRDNAIEAIDDAITKMREDMKRTEKRFVNNEWVEVPVYVLKPADIVQLIDRFQVLFNRPSQITEERNLGLNVTAAGVGPDILKGIIEATRGLDTVDAARSPIPRIDRAREN